MNKQYRCRIERVELNILVLLEKRKSNGYIKTKVGKNHKVKTIILSRGPTRNSSSVTLCRYSDIPYFV